MADPEQTLETTFDPSKYVRQISGKDYIEVKYRIQWFRDVHPNGRIDVELVEHNAQQHYAIFKATVTTEQGGMSSDYGSEEKSDFGDYIEKAATKAIGRALGSLGFGTQFTDEHAFGADAGRVVDSPVDRSQQGGAPTAIRRNEAGVGMATDRQIKYLSTLLVARGDNPDTYDFAGMTMTDASALIERYKTQQ